MLSGKNTIQISCAGSGKTTDIVKSALSNSQDRILVTTYTNENIDQIRTFIIDRVGCIPTNITVQSWFSFLLRDGVRPYQNHMSDHKRVRSIYFQLGSPKYQKKENYFTAANDIYSNKVSEFVHECNNKTGGLIAARLEKMYKRIYVDELQDFAGYDLHVLEMLFSSNAAILAVGDPRQATYSTNNAQKNRQYRKSKIYAWLKKKDKSGEVNLEEQCDCHRSNQAICDYGDKLFPEFPRTTSRLEHGITGHDGVFLVHKDDVASYVGAFAPTVLRYSIRTKTYGFRAVNIGMAKGRTFKRVLIFPTKPMLEYLRSEDLSKAGDKSKLYVAVTRAKHSVAFVIDKQDVSGSTPFWRPQAPYETP